MSRVPQSQETKEGTEREIQTDRQTERQIKRQMQRERVRESARRDISHRLLSIIEFHFIDLYEKLTKSIISILKRLLALE